MNRLVTLPELADSDEPCCLPPCAKRFGVRVRSTALAGNSSAEPVAHSTRSALRNFASFDWPPQSWIARVPPKRCSAHALQSASRNVARGKNVHSILREPATRRAFSRHTTPRPPNKKVRAGLHSTARNSFVDVKSHQLTSHHIIHAPGTGSSGDPMHASSARDGAGGSRRSASARDCDRYAHHDYGVDASCSSCCDHDRGHACLSPPQAAQKRMQTPAPQRARSERGTDV